MILLVVLAANSVLEILQRLKSARQLIVQVNSFVLVEDGLPPPELPILARHVGGV